VPAVLCLRASVGGSCLVLHCTCGCLNVGYNVQCGSWGQRLRAAIACALLLERDVRILKVLLERGFWGSGSRGFRSPKGNTPRRCMLQHASTEAAHACW
jgi:hypothetical protein